MTDMAGALKHSALPVVQAITSLTLGPHARARVEEEWRALTHRRMLAADRARVPAILATLAGQPEAAAAESWRVQRTQWTDGRVTLISVGPPRQPPAAILKLPHTTVGEAFLRQQCRVLETLQANSALGAWRALLPTPLSAGTAEGQFYLAERALPGRTMRWFLPNSPTRAREFISAAVSATAQLHQQTARKVAVDAPMLERWVDVPLRRLASATTNNGAVARLAQILHARLEGRTLTVGWIHGDFWAGNLLVAPDGTTITGIVDWDLAAPDEPPIHDLLNFVLSTEWVPRGRDVGDVVCRRLKGRFPSVWTDAERAIMADAIPWSVGDAAWEQAILLLYWLRSVTTDLDKAPYRCQNGWWLRENVEGVLQLL